MRKAIALLALALLAFAGVAHADTFSWSEDFQGDTLADYWQLQCDDVSTIGVVADPADTESGNKVLMVDTWTDGGMAYANLLNTAVNGLDGSQDITATFRFYLGDGDNNQFNILGTSFTALVDAGTLYSPNDGNEDPFALPVGEWINFEYHFTPEESAGVTTHTVHATWSSDEFSGEFDNVPSSLDDGVAFFVGDKEADGANYGLGYWDDFQITGTARQEAPVPEPGSLLSLVSGIAGLVSSIFGLRKSR